MKCSGGGILMARLTSFSIRFVAAVTQGVSVDDPLIWASTMAKKYNTTQTQCGIAMQKNRGWW